jgi:hypothetical protein
LQSAYLPLQQQTEKKIIMRKSVEKRKTTKAEATSSLLLQLQHETGKLPRRGSCIVYNKMRTSVENWEVIAVVVGGVGVFFNYLGFFFGFFVFGWMPW